MATIEQVMRGANNAEDWDGLDALISICNDFVNTIRILDAPDQAETYVGAAAAEIAKRAVSYLHAHQFDYADAKADLPR